MPIAMSDNEFEAIVGGALDLVPAEFTSAMSNVVILVDAVHPNDPHLLGLYEGVALTRRDTTYGFALPDAITIYREPIIAMCNSRDEVMNEVAVTVIHEIAHHFGISDEWLHAHGWG